jgi:hypothetical protein
MNRAASTAPHETAEWWPFTVTVDGVPVTTGVDTCVTTSMARPLSWTPVTVRDGKTLIRIAGLTAGTYRAWARVTRSDETAVVELGYFSIS